MNITGIILLALCITFTALISFKQDGHSDLCNKIYLTGVRNEIIEMYRDGHEGGPLPHGFIDALDNLSPLSIIELKHMFADANMDRERLAMDLLEGTFEETINQPLENGYFTNRHHYRKPIKNK